VSFGLALLQDRPMTGLVALWQACDKAGLSLIGIPDTPAVARELYVSAAVCAAQTADSQIMPTVTNPVTRDPSVTAAALLTLEDLAPGRISLGIGTGDSALWGVGLKPATVSDLREYVIAVKKLLRGEEANFHGRSFRIMWNGSLPRTPIPVIIACSGPRVLQMAAQAADGLILAMGYGDENLNYIRGLITESCAAIGRNPAELTLWWHSTLDFAPTIEAAMEKSLGVNPRWITLGGTQAKQVPEEYRAPLRQLNADIKDLAAVYRTARRGAILVERAKRLGVYDWLLSRASGLWGTPADIVNRLTELQLKGVDNWLLYFEAGSTDVDRREFIERLSEEIMPHLPRRPATPGSLRLN
jgi:5,10-methylenetetrahydromethanopterin reductase